jgi:hypothetical protein
MPLLYFAAGYLVGWLVARRKTATATAQVFHQGATDVLSSVGKLAGTGALGSMDGLKLKTGDDKAGVQLLIKARASSNVPLDLDGLN